MIITKGMTTNDKYAYGQEDVKKIIEAYGDNVYYLAYANVKSKDVAEDIYQEVFLKLILQKKRIEPEEHLKAWLLRVTINQCKDYWKSGWVQRVFQGMELDESKLEKLKENDVSACEVHGPVTELVWQLPAKYRNVIHLYYYEDYSVKEIAKLLEKSENTISSQLARGREQLRNRLKEV